MTKYYIFFFLFCISKHIKAQDSSINLESLLHKSHAERTLILTAFYEKGIRDLDSITIFSTIKSIENAAKKNSDHELILEVKLMRAHYYMYRNYFNKELVVKKAKVLIDIAKKDNILWLEIRAESMLANYLYNDHKDYGNGFEHFERTAQLLENVSGVAFPLKQICLFQIGAVYYDFREYENAVTFLKIAERTPSSLNNYYYQMHTTNTLGVAYRKMNRMDTSYYYFNKTLDKAIKADDNVWIGLSSGNLGYNYYLDGEFDKAKPLLELDYKTAQEQQESGWLADALANLAANTLEQNDISKTHLYIDQAQQYAVESNQYERWAKIFPIKAKLAAVEAKPELAVKYLDSALTVNDSLSKIFDARKLLLAKQRIANEKQQLEDEKNSFLNARRLFQRNGIIIVLTLLIFIGLLLYNRKKLRHKNKIQILGSEKQLALQKLSLASKRLDDFKTALYNKNNTINQLERVLTMANDSDVKRESIRKQVEELTILTEKDWRQFKALFEEVHIGFFSRLKGIYPNLTPSEIKLMAISRLQLDNKEMSLMLGIGTSAIRQAKSRLRKKLALKEHQSLQELALST